MTLKAVRALRAADVVLYDDLVTAPLLDYARREARRILVGKKGYGPACKQTEINALMVSLAKEGQRVVRLKSGDPMIFGRAGEEMHELEAADIAYEVIPGISAVQAAAAGLKVSLTHRDYARRLQIVTGHSREGRLPDNLDWKALADPQATTAVYMALRTFRELSDRLIAAGLPGATPAVAVFDAARETKAGSSRRSPDCPKPSKSRRLSGPCLVLIGQVFAGLEPGETGRPGHEPERARGEVLTCEAGSELRPLEGSASGRADFCLSGTNVRAAHSSHTGSSKTPMVRGIRAEAHCFGWRRLPAGRVCSFLGPGSAGGGTKDRPYPGSGPGCVLARRSGANSGTSLRIV